MIQSLLFGALIGFLEDLPALETSVFGEFSAVGEYFIIFFQSGLSLFVSLAGVNAVRFISYYLLAVIALDTFYLAYQLVWFFLKKIPMLDIKP